MTRARHSLTGRRVDDGAVQVGFGRGDDVTAVRFGSDCRTGMSEDLGDGGVVGEAQLVECIEYLTDGRIHCFDHRRIDGVVLGDARQAGVERVGPDLFLVDECSLGL